MRHQSRILNAAFTNMKTHHKTESDEIIKKRFKISGEDIKVLVKLQTRKNIVNTYIIPVIMLQRAVLHSCLSRVKKFVESLLSMSYLTLVVPISLRGYYPNS
jgi:hypothetical protein